VAAEGSQLPLIDVSGGPRERGRAHGEALRREIERGLELSRRHSAPSDPQKLARHLDAAERWTPGVIEELKGIAEGANRSFEAVFEYNLADERRVFGSLERCSSAGLRRDTAGRPVSGQTMDTPEWFESLRVAVRACEKETGLATLAFTIAGSPGLCGVNSAGVAVWCNALYQLASSSEGVPVTCIVRRLLSGTSLAASREFVTGVPHASGQNYLLGSPDGIASFECSAHAVVEVRPRGNEVWHTNHPVLSDDRASGVDGASSLARDSFLERALPGAGSSEAVRGILADRSVPVCKTGGAGGDSYTLWAVVAEHSAPPVVVATAGPPAESPWLPVDVSPAAGHVQG
jgi:isopenicillin-N N-acyltransferase like protein